MAKSERVGQLEDQLKARDQRIGELHIEVDELRDLVRRFEEQDEDEIHAIESWVEALRCERADDGTWSLGPWWEAHKERVEKHKALVREWNQYVEEFNRGGIKRPVGRPLQASEAQCSDVLKMRKRGASLRDIADETSLGLPTVRTIVGKKAGTDRTSSRNLKRIEIDRLKAAAWKRTVRTIDDMPRRAHQLVKNRRALLTEAKGLGRA